MDDKTRELIETLKRNPALVQSLFRTQDGQKLIHMLTQGDQGAALQRATKSAMVGDTAGMVQMVSQVMHTPEGAEIVERINKSFHQ